MDVRGQLAFLFHLTDSFEMREFERMVCNYARPHYSNFLYLNIISSLHSNIHFR